VTASARAGAALIAIAHAINKPTGIARLFIEPPCAGSLQDGRLRGK
jgi:hypothetical protein